MNDSSTNAKADSGPVTRFKRLKEMSSTERSSWMSELSQRRWEKYYREEKEYLDYLETKKSEYDVKSKDFPNDALLELKRLRKLFAKEFLPGQNVSS